MDGKTFTMFLKHLNELKQDVLENKGHKLSPDSFLIFLDKIKNMSHSEQLNNLIIKKLREVNLQTLETKKMLNSYQ